MLKNQHLTKNIDPRIGAFLVFGTFLAHETQVPAASGNESQQLDGCRRSPAAVVQLSGAACQRSPPFYISRKRPLKNQFS